MDRFALVEDVKRYFSILELVPESVFKELGEDKCWNLFPDESLFMLVTVREAWGKPLIINSKSKGYQYSGYRPIDCSIGAKYSGHRFCLVFDAKDARMTLEANIELYNFLLEKGEHLGVTELEDRSYTIDGKNVGWCH